MPVRSGFPGREYARSELLSRSGSGSMNRQKSSMAIARAIAIPNRLSSGGRPDTGMRADPMGLPRVIARSLRAEREY